MNGARASVVIEAWCGAAWFPFFTFTSPFILYTILYTNIMFFPPFAPTHRWIPKIQRDLPRTVRGHGGRWARQPRWQGCVGPEKPPHNQQHQRLGFRRGLRQRLRERVRSAAWLLARRGTLWNTPVFVPGTYCGHSFWERHPNNSKKKWIIHSKCFLSPQNMIKFSLALKTCDFAVLSVANQSINQVYWLYVCVYITCFPSSLGFSGFLTILIKNIHKTCFLTLHYWDFFYFFWFLRWIIE